MQQNQQAPISWTHRYSERGFSRVPSNYLQDIIRYTPLSHPFVERLIGTIRREYLDQLLFWNASDLERKLEAFRQYYNAHRVHTSLDGDAPSEICGETVIHRADLYQFRWKAHCHELFQLPAAA